MAKIKIYFDTRRSKQDGTCNVYLRLSINAKQKHYLITSVKPAHRAGGENPVKSGDILHKKKNQLIRKKLNYAK